MFKFAIAAVAAAPFLATAAFAGPYVNVEANAGLTGANYTGTVTEAHVGYDFALSDTVSGYAQVGPALLTPDGGSATTKVSGKVGATVAAAERVSVYGEYYFLTGDKLTSNVKAGVKYSF